MSLPSPARIFCIGRNYDLHAAELGQGPASAPVVFMKPTSAIVADGGSARLPRGLGSVHHELELVLLLQTGGRELDAAAAAAAIGGATLGVDLTLRELQQTLKAAGLPWERAKAFDDSALLGRFLPATAAILDEVEMTLAVDGEIRQRGHTRQMRWSPVALVGWLSRCWQLQAGDVIYTGTPAGVGPVGAGSELAASSPTLGRYRWTLR